MQNITKCDHMISTWANILSTIKFLLRGYDQIFAFSQKVFLIINDYLKTIFSANSFKGSSVLQKLLYGCHRLCSGILKDQLS